MERPFTAESLWGLSLSAFHIYKIILKYFCTAHLSVFIFLNSFKSCISFLCVVFHSTVSPKCCPCSPVSASDYGKFGSFLVPKASAAPQTSPPLVFYWKTVGNQRLIWIKPERIRFGEECAVLWLRSSLHIKGGRDGAFSPKSTKNMDYSPLLRPTHDRRPLIQQKTCLLSCFNAVLMR